MILPSGTRDILVDVRRRAAFAAHLARWIGLGSLSGVLAGGSSFVFLEGLERCTAFRVAHPWTLWLLPGAGMAIGVGYHYAGGRARQGSALLFDEIHQPTEWLPRRLAPLVLVGTWVTHLFGGSAGREGTALQMSGGLSDLAARALGLDAEDRRMLLIAALAGGFGAVFGVPLAGTVFALEVQSIGRVRYEALVPALTASLVGDRVVRALGHHHAIRPTIEVTVTGSLLARVAAAGVVFGLAAAAFAGLVHWVRACCARWVGWPPLRTALGGVGVAGLAAMFGHEYLGLSLPLIDRALTGQQLSFAVAALKIAFTVLTLGSGFPGGEVTPLFVIGSTLGAALAAPLHLGVALLAAVGFVAVFGGAANTPLACTIMAVELFGSAVLAPAAVGCVAAYMFAGHSGIYSGQRVSVPKGPNNRTGRS